jgi:hypothetical protein
MGFRIKPFVDSKVPHCMAFPSADLSADTAVRLNEVGSKSDKARTADKYLTVFLCIYMMSYLPEMLPYPSIIQQNEYVRTKKEKGFPKCGSKTPSLGGFHAL